MPRPPFVSFNIRTPAGQRRATAQNIVNTITDEIESGRLAPGLRLPPVRVLEHTLGISKNTVQAAYDELVARGILESRARDGVYVAATSPTEERIEPLGATPASLVSLAPDVRPRTHEERIDLSRIFIDPDLLPVGQLVDCFRSVLSSPGLQPFYDDQGYPPLREIIAERLRSRGMEAYADDVIITTGSQQGIDMVARSLATKRIAVENPVYSYARGSFTSVGAELVPLSFDPFESIPMDAWTEQIEQKKPSLLYAITSYQNPTGYSYSTYEIVQLLEMSQHYGFALLEDDWGSDMLSGSEYRPTLRALGGPNVLYLNSFTKKLLPSLRVGYLVCNPATRGPLIAAKKLSTLANAMVIEEMLFEFLDRGYYDTHLKKLQAALDIRYHACLDALRELMPEGVRWTTPGGGPTLWLMLPDGISAANVRDTVAKMGVRVEDARNHFAGTPHQQGFRIGYAFLPEQDLRRGLERLADAIHKERGLAMSA